MANIVVRSGEGRGCGYRKFLLCCKILQGRGHCKLLCCGCVVKQRRLWSNCCVVRYSHRELLGWKRRFSSLKYGNLDSKWSRF